MNRRKPPTPHLDQTAPAAAEAQNWDRQGLPQGPRYGRTQYAGRQLADPVASAPEAESGYPDDRGEFGHHTYGQGGRRTREPYAAGRGGRGR